MGNEPISLTADETWLLHTLLASGQANPSDVGAFIQPSTLPAQSPSWPRVRAAVDGLVALELIEAKAQHALGSPHPVHFINVRFTRKGLLLVRNLPSQ